MSDYLDPVFDARYFPAIAQALKSHLLNFSGWEFCDWQDLSAHTPLRALAPAAEDTPCSRVPLASSFERFLAQRPHGLKRNLRRYREKALAFGAMHFRISADPEPYLLRNLIELHRARWQHSGRPGMIDANAAEGFVQDAARTMAEEGMLRIFTLYFREQVGAIVLALRNEGTLFSYLSAFDPEHEVLGLGRELLKCSLEHAHAERYQCWDFMRGDEPYKLTWGAQVVPKCRLRFDRSILI
jgi:CelD/BcsL family acetyltransferase involved in cellulose biosynthesis